MTFKFEKLKVWEKAIELANEVHFLTKKWPKEELYILTPQIKRASDSISLNIAEGSTGQSNPEFSKFIGYAIRSALEVVNALYLAKGRGLINSDEFHQFYKKLTEIIKMLQALRNSIKN